MKLFLFLAVSLLLGTLSVFSQIPLSPLNTVGQSGSTMVSSSGITLRTSIGNISSQKNGTSSTILEEGTLPQIRNYSGVTTTFTFVSTSSWNMISLPLRPTDARTATLFPTASSSAFGYNGGYQVKDTLQFGAGYWLKFPSPDALLFTGTASDAETISVKNQWNIIGGLSYPVLTNQITSNDIAVSSAFFGFSSQTGYSPTAVLIPGKAYWVKISGTGHLILKVAGVPAFKQAPATLTIDENMGEIIITDANGNQRSLFITTSNSSVDILHNELPPSPPTGIFDARFKSQRIIEQYNTTSSAQQFPIALSSATYPLHISIKDANKTLAHSISYKDENNTLHTVSLSNNKEIIIVKEATSLALQITDKAPLPTIYSLLQNYPNPFNPTTTITYDIPAGISSVQVTLRIYNMLGQELATLVNSQLPPGEYTTQWNANDYSSGTYYYKLTAGDFLSIKKMLLVK